MVKTDIQTSPISQRLLKKGMQLFHLKNFFFIPGNTLATLDPDPLNLNKKGDTFSKPLTTRKLLYLFKILSILPLVSRLLLIEKLERAECLVFVLKILQLRAANRCSNPTPRAEQVPPE